MNNSASIYESPGSQFFRNTTGIQSGTDAFHESRFLLTYLTIFGVKEILSVTCPEFFWADQLHLGVPPPPFCHYGWQKFLNLVPPDALKMHSLAVPVLRFLCETFSKLRKLNNETLFSVDVLKKS